MIKSLNFLLKFIFMRLPYAGNGTELIKSSRPNSHDFLYKEGEYEYIDTYLGAERFIGEEAIFYKNQPVWAMNYAGIEMSENFSSEFLKKALSKATEDRPYRGPQIFEEGEFLYFCDYTGDFESFHGHEEIYCRKEKVYQCTFHGGIVK